MQRPNCAWPATGCEPSRNGSESRECGLRISEWEEVQAGDFRKVRIGRAQLKSATSGDRGNQTVGCRHGKSLPAQARVDATGVDEIVVRLGFRWPDGQIAF